MEQITGKKLLHFSIKASVSAIILYSIFKTIGLKEVLNNFKDMNLYYFFMASLIHLLSVYISSIRLKLFIEEKISVNKLFAVNMIGTFFNNFLPGATGGDAVKLYYIYKHTGKGMLSAASIFMDRYVGLFSLISIGFVSFLFGYNKLIGTGVEYFIPLIFVMFIITSGIIFGLRLGRRFKRIAVFYDYFHMYMKQKKIILNSILYSVVIQLLVINAAYIVSVGLGANMSLANMLIFLPIIITITSVPISISGMGVREGAFVILLGLVDVDKGMAVSISFGWFLSYTIVSILGLAYYFIYKVEIKPNEKNDTTTKDKG